MRQTPRNSSQRTAGNSAAVQVHDDITSHRVTARELLTHSAAPALTDYPPVGRTSLDSEHEQYAGGMRTSRGALGARCSAPSTRPGELYRGPLPLIRSC